MIDRYADIHNVDKSQITKMKYMHFEFLKKYAKFAQLEYTQGKDLLRKEFIIRMGH